MRRQRGVALVTALLVVALVVAATSAMIYQQRLDMRRTANITLQDQARLYTQAMENITYDLLGQDANSTKLDDWGEAWAVTGVVLPFQDGILAPRVFDLNSRFNVNNMVLYQGKATGRAAHAHDKQRFINLIAEIQANANNYTEAEREVIEQMNGQELANALVDWLDPDADVSFPGGAEDSDYMLLEWPYRAANGPMTDISELRLVKGFTPEVFAILKRFLVALPITEQKMGVNNEPVDKPTAINVNTAIKEVLAALSQERGCMQTGNMNRPQPLPMQMMMAVGEENPNTGTSTYATSNDFLTQIAAGCAMVGGLPKSGNQPPPGQQAPDEVLSASSEYFLFHAEVTMPAADNTGLAQNAILRRIKDAKGQLKMDTILRSQDTGQYWLSHTPY